jgi:hypothetical protein
MGQPLGITQRPVSRDDISSTCLPAPVWRQGKAAYCFLVTGFFTAPVQSNRFALQ